MNSYELKVFGSRGSYSVFGKQYEEFGGQTNCYIIHRNDYALILDCGSGLICAKDLIKNCTKIDVLITHAHYDHIIGLLNTTLFPKTAEVNFYGAVEKWGRDGFELFREPFWPINPRRWKMNSIHEAEIFTLNGDINVSAFATKHSSDSYAYRVETPNKKIVLLSDFDNHVGIDLSFVEGVDYLLYDGMFDEEGYQKHSTWGHSTWIEGCKIAKEYNVKNLIVTHLNPNYDDNKLLGMEKASKKEFQESTFARFGDSIEL